MRAAIISMALLLCAGLCAQDPPESKPARPTPPPKAGRLPPVEEPFVSSVRRDDLLQQFTPPNPIQGFYRLRARVEDGQLSKREGTGYIVIGRRHLSLHLMSQGINPNVPMIRAGFRTYSVVGDRLQMSTLVGHLNKPNGDVAVEGKGLTVTRRYELIGPLLRIYQDDRSYLEFERIE